MLSTLPASPSTPTPRILVQDLQRIADWQDQIDWQPFFPGVEIHRLYGDGLTGPTASLIRYAPGAKIPSHLHGGYEHILVLSGSQRDDDGTFPEGSLLVSAPGTKHSIASDQGCIVLAIYEKPVKFLS